MVISEVSQEHPELAVHQKHNVVRERGIEQNFERLLKGPKGFDLKKHLSRLDSQVLRDMAYFVGFEYRPMIYKNVRAIYEDIWGELRPVVSALTQGFPISVNAGNNVYFWLPEDVPGKQRVQQGEARSGLHIHVGADGVFEHLDPGLKAEELGAKMVQRVLAIKKLLTLYWLVEPNLQTLHASWRSEDARYSGLLRVHSNLAFYPQVREKAGVKQPVQHWHHEEEDRLIDGGYKTAFYNLDTFNAASDKLTDTPIVEILRKKLGARMTDHDRAAIETIWETTNMDQLAWLASSYFGNRRSSLNLHQLLPPRCQFAGGSVREEEKRTGTVEFRLMQGSFDIDAIAAWTDVVLQLTEACITDDQDRFVDFVDRAVTGPDQAAAAAGDKTKAFIKRLGLEEASYAYKFYHDGRQADLDKQANPREVLTVAY
ncbi:hypothetical protein PG985_014898 [Apiospora marii]|uniref:Uncharacterized protein n=1 Tax=Apiospora marii TaxID=335849 RepID=A0ABR1RIW4_9PEZI